MSAGGTHRQTRSVVRGQASGENFAALESAVSKLESVCAGSRTASASRGSRTPISVAAATEVAHRHYVAVSSPKTARPVADDVEQTWDDGVTEHSPDRSSASRSTKAPPMTIDDAVRDGTGRARLLPVPRQGKPTNRPSCTAGMRSTTD